MFAITFSMPSNACCMCAGFCVGSCRSSFFFWDHTLAKMCKLSVSQFSVSTNTSRFRVLVCCISASSAMGHVDMWFFGIPHAPKYGLFRVLYECRFLRWVTYFFFFVWIKYKPKCDAHMFMEWL